MSNVLFAQANPRDHRDELVNLNIEYLTRLYAEVERVFGVSVDEIRGMSLADYVSNTVEKVCGDPPPRGVFYLIDVDGVIAGMCGLRWIRPGVAEIKRIYVRPVHRGMTLGEVALRRLLADAREFGFERLCLDTGPFMKSA